MIKKKVNISILTAIIKWKTSCEFNRNIKHVENVRVHRSLSRFTVSECASSSLVNARVVWFLQHQNVRLLIWSMCE